MANNTVNSEDNITTEYLNENEDSDNLFEDLHLDFEDLREDDFEDNEDVIDKLIEDALSDSENTDSKAQDNKDKSFREKQREKGKKKLIQARKDREAWNAALSGLHLSEKHKSLTENVYDGAHKAFSDVNFIIDDSAKKFNSYREKDVDIKKANKEISEHKDIQNTKEPVSADIAEEEYKEFSHLRMYDLVSLAGNTVINSAKKSISQSMSGISGDYSQESREITAELGGVFLAVCSKAAAGIDMLSHNNTVSAVETFEKICKEPGFKRFKIDSFTKETRDEVTKKLVNSGFEKKDIDNLFKYRNTVLQEASFKSLINEEFRKNPDFVRGELKERILRKGLKNLPVYAERQLIDALNKNNTNAEVRNLNLAKMSPKQIKAAIDRFSENNSLDDTSKLLLNKSLKLSKRQKIVSKSLSGALVRVYEKIRPSSQDLFTGTIKSATKKVHDTGVNVRFTITGAKTAKAFAKKSYKMGKSLISGIIVQKNREFKKSGKSFNDMRKGSSLKVKNNKSALNNVKTAVYTSYVASTGLKAASSSITSAKTKEEEEKNKEKRQNFRNAVIEGRNSAKTLKKLTGRFRHAAGNEKKVLSSMKHIKKDGAKAAKAGKTTVNATKTIVNGTGSIARYFSSILKSIPPQAWIVIGIVILILFLFIAIKDAKLQENIINNAFDDINSTVTKDLNSFRDDIIDGFKQTNESIILVSDKITSDGKYMDINEYLRLIQRLDEEREENAKKFANAKINTYEPESLGLNMRQKNGTFGQNSIVQAGQAITHYGSLDKDNCYTLHYLDAYGNEIANHSTNARDILSLCAVMFSNYADDKNVFPYLLEDQWWLMNPHIEWQESPVYHCETSKLTVSGETSYVSACHGSGVNDNYKANAGYGYDFSPLTFHADSGYESYCCNDYDSIVKISQLKDKGVKVTGDVCAYNPDGCSVRTIQKHMCIPVDKRYWDATGVSFTYDDYDLYDAYTDGWLSYSEYRRLWDECDEEGSLDVTYINGSFQKEEKYCPGNHYITCCFGHKDVDLYITLYDKDYAVSANLYPDSLHSHTGEYGKYEEFLDAFLDDKAFLNEGRIRWADNAYNADWFDLYGIDVLGGAGFEIGKTLSDADISKILERLSDEGLTINQQAVIEFALKYVGRIPYYFGGKASFLEYEKNFFGTLVEADSKGRTRKGLDCSGFVQWVFANNGVRLPSSTGGYSGYSLTKDHSSLKVGDLGFLAMPGAKNNHVGIYAGIDENGNDLWIHCNASSCNVSVNNYNGFRYYLNF